MSSARYTGLMALMLAAGCGGGAAQPGSVAPESAPGGRAVEPYNPATRRAQPAAAAAGPTLYQRLGGQAAIAIVVDTFTARVHGDSTLAPLFRGVDMDHFKRVLAELLCMATGGGCSYSGRSMRDVHTGLNITGAQFDTVVGYLAATLDQFNVPAREKNELLGLLAPMRGDIVGH